MAPRISVIMSAYNAERHLREAVDSILNQTFRDFELIIIDDCSTDSTAQVLDSFGDTRITRLSNKKNMGAGLSRNRGMDIAAGEYIAVMDADDVSLPERFAKQVAFMDDHPDCAVAATKMALIDETGQLIGHALEDIPSLTWEQVRKVMPRVNCIGHSTVLMRASSVQDYRYRNVLAVEDYDLWLRLCSDGKYICKLDEVLVNYRVHSASLTSLTNRKNPLKMVKIRVNYLLYQLAQFHLTHFELAILKHTLLDTKAFVLQQVKSLTKSLLVKVFRLLALPVAFILKRKCRSSVYFFFPYWSMGGAEKIHAAIVSCLADQRPYVFFDSRSANNLCKSLFPSEATLVDLRGVSTSKGLLLYWWAILLAEMVNRQFPVAIFGSNSALFYCLIAYIKPHVHAVDLVHAFGKEAFPGIEHISLPAVRRLNNRAIYHKQTLEDMREQYVLHQVDSALLDRVILIGNEIDVPDSYPIKPPPDILNIVYVGRGSPEKRIHLIETVALQCHEAHLPVHFTFVGDVDACLTRSMHPNCTFMGLISDPEAISRVYKETHVLILASTQEGFPVVIMEAMAHGVIPLSTAVGGIPTHIVHDINGLIVSNNQAAEIVSQLWENICQLVNDPARVERLSREAYSYAKRCFSRGDFCSSYRKLILRDAAKEQQNEGTKQGL